MAREGPREPPARGPSAYPGRSSGRDDWRSGLRGHSHSYELIADDWSARIATAKVAA